MRPTSSGPWLAWWTLCAQKPPQLPGPELAGSSLGAGVVLAVLAAALMHASWNAMIRGAPDKGLYTVLMHGCSAVLAMVLLPWVGLPAWDSAPYLVASALLHTVLYPAVDAHLRRGPTGGELSAHAGAGALAGLPGVGPAARRVTLRAHVGGGGRHSGWCGLYCPGQRAALARGVVAPLRKAALLNALIIAAYTLVDGQGVRLSGNPVGYVLVLALLEPWGVIAYQWLRRPDALAGYVRRHWATGFLGAGVATSAYAIVLWAMTLGADCGGRCLAGEFCHLCRTDRLPLVPGRALAPGASGGRAGRYRGGADQALSAAGRLVALHRSHCPASARLACKRCS